MTTVPTVRWTSLNKCTFQINLVIIAINAAHFNMRLSEFDWLIFITRVFSNLIGLQYFCSAVPLSDANDTRPLPRMQSGRQRQTS